GSGTMNLSAANTFTGGLYVNQGTVRFQAGDSVPDTTAVVMGYTSDVSPATFECKLDINDQVVSIGSLEGGGEVSLGGAGGLGGGSLTIGTTQYTRSTLYEGAITGVGSLTKVGAGELTLTG